MRFRVTESDIQLSFDMVKERAEAVNGFLGGFWWRMSLQNIRVNRPARSFVLWGRNLHGNVASLFGRKALPAQPQCELGLFRYDRWRMISPRDKLGIGIYEYMHGMSF